MEEREDLYSNASLEDLYSGNVYKDKPSIDSLMHYGKGHLDGGHSGRYPWGSGDDGYQREVSFLNRVRELKKNGFKETSDEVMKEFGISLEDYRNEKTWANEMARMQKVKTAEKLRDQEGLSTNEIGRRMGVNESTVRSWFDEERKIKMMQTKEVADFLQKQVDEKGMIDVGPGVEHELGISRTKLDYALWALKEKAGYEVYSGRMDQVTNPGMKTTNTVLCKPGTEHKDIYNLENIKTINEYTSHDDGKTFTKFVYPASMDSKRLKIRYSDEKGPDGFTGDDKDGIVEIRRGVKDLSLGGDHYSQVRILVDGTHYIKGMAVYSDNMPDGVDVVFNTNKSSKVPKMDVLKPIKSDPENPFGALIKPNGQMYYEDKDGKKKLGLINKKSAEGDWTDWQDSLPSQFLGKQPYSLAKKQLDLAKVSKQTEFDDICKLQNPTVKKYFLQKFADSCDSAAVDLKAAALPGQKYHVIIPVNSLKDTEIYAPQYKNGTKLALVRYPHGGTFEIPILTVNNKNQLGKKVIGTDSIDAVGITKKVADRLSGADFDGDTVMCIPTHDPKGRVKITSTPPLKGLEGFDPKLKYGPETYAGKDIKLMKNEKTGKDATQSEMGKISNLITDMTLAHASEDELARAVRHSMVVIDAGKHKLNYKQSEIDNDIAGLRRKYQVKIDKNGNERYGGASTLLSRAKGEVTVDKRQGTPKINKKGESYYDPTKPEGAYIYKKADDLYYPNRTYNKDTGIVTIKTTDGKKISYNVADKEAVNKYYPVEKKDPATGKVIGFTNKSGTIEYAVKKKGQKSTNMGEVEDAYTLVSKKRHPMELLYADYANSMKALANTARKEMVYTPKISYDRNAANTYKAEVQSLKDKLKTSELNAVREREAQRRSNAEVAAKIASDPTMKNKDIKKARQQAITKNRNEVGSVARSKRNIVITDREWEAIQKGAISETQLRKILNNTDTDVLRQKAMPKAVSTVSAAKLAKAKQMEKSGYSLAEIANSIGCSPSTISKYLKGKV